LSERQVQRLKQRFQPDSVAWVQHGNRGHLCQLCLALEIQGRIARTPVSSQKSMSAE
jgi:hypothetical protein